MYICQGCNQTFDIMPEANEAYDCENNATIADNYCCYNEAIVEAVKCAKCEEWHDPADVDGGLCKQCRIEVQKALESFVDSLSCAEQEFVRENLLADY